MLNRVNVSIPTLSEHIYSIRLKNVTAAKRVDPDILAQNTASHHVMILSNFSIINSETVA